LLLDRRAAAAYIRAMRASLRKICAPGFGLILLGAFAAPLPAAEPPDFDRAIAPLLAGRCLDCHSGRELAGGLDLATARGIQRGGESGEPAIVSGKPAQSPLWQRIAAGEMPPKHPLPETERAAIRAWIESGAAWGTDPIDPFRFTSAARAGYDWWSLQELKRPAVPEASPSPEWGTSPIDAFVFSQLQAKGLTPSPRAAPHVLVRRLYFDLIGLPPSPEEVDAFVADSAVDPQGALERLADKLLQSPHYGERWARHWLDIARFGESDGYEYDKMRPHAWRYRDWVIDALNRDLPFDEFARLQIAGDILAPDDPDAIVATGFLVAGAYDGLMPQAETMRLVMRQDELEDLVGLVSQTFLGLTVNCARCHDHKFDPVLQTDYYRLAAALGGVKRGDRDVSRAAPPEMVARFDAKSAELKSLVEPTRKAIVARREAELAARTIKQPEPLASWEFDEGLEDAAGSLHASTIGGKARVENGSLVLDGKGSFALTATVDRPLGEKTLEAWVQLDSLDQRGGGVLGVQTVGGGTFDAIVFGEQEPRRWMAGSEFFRRTHSLAASENESEADKRFVHLAIVYRPDGQIVAYRDGAPYGKPYRSEKLAEFAAGSWQVVFGLRHSPAGGNKHLAGRIDRVRLYDRALSAEEVAASAGTISTHVSDEEIDAELDDAGRRRRQQLSAEVRRLRDQIASYRSRKAFAVTPQPAPVAHLLVRGNVTQPAEPIAAGGVLALTASQPDFGLAPDASDGQRRKKLAEWITRADNPLFARTIANRLWHYHFGRGLVETPNDLGFSGGRPTHPELLDWLAAELVAQKWSLKEMHRRIVTSAAWQQASQPRADCLAADADNRLVWRYSPRRLEAEAVRDATLAVAGQFNPQRGGPSVQDFRPYVYKSTQYYEPLDPIGPEFNRRSIYRMWARGGKSPLLDTFDCPDPSTITPRRGSTTTPLQALSLMNNSFTLRMADHFAERLAAERPDDLGRQVARGFELAYGRVPTAEESAVAVEFVREHRLPAFCRVLLNTNGFLYLE
jgi:mono/diheme cytochrome c family protein